MTQPTRMPRTQLKFKSGLENPLVPERDEDYYSSPNPMRDHSGVFEAVKAAGPAPYRGALPGRVAFFLIFVLFGGLFALTGFRFLLSGLSATGSWRDKFDMIDIGFAGLGSIFVLVGAYAISRDVSRHRRIVSAWKNGWIDYYPALVGQFYHCRTDVSSSRDSGRTFYYYYRAPLKVLHPDGSLKEMHSFEFQMKRNPDWYRTRFNMASSAEDATVDEWNNNGWAIVGISRRPGQTHAELDSGLTGKQREAVFNLSERNWRMPNSWSW